MCGSNNREESDRRPVYMCPECVTKVWWATNCDPIERFEGLMNFCKEQKLQAESEYYQKAIERLAR